MQNLWIHRVYGICAFLNFDLWGRYPPSFDAPQYRFKSRGMEITGPCTNRRARHGYGYPPFCLESLWCASLWTPEEASGWLVTCSRRRCGSCCHVLGTNTWHVFLVRRDTVLSATLRQVFKCKWWRYGGALCAICCPWAMYNDYVIVFVVPLL